MTGIRAVAISLTVFTLLGASLLHAQPPANEAPHQAQANAPRVVWLISNPNARFIPWAVAAITAAAVIGFFVGTSATRRRIVRSILTKNAALNETKTRKTPRRQDKRDQLSSVIFNTESELVSASSRSVRDFISPGIESVEPKDHVNLAIRKMNEHGVDCVYVCDGYRNLVGLITRSDIHDREGTKVQEVMTTDIISTSPTDSLRHAIETLNSSGFSQIPICRDQQIEGELSLADAALIADCMFDFVDGLTNELRHEQLAPC